VASPDDAEEADGIPTVAINGLGRIAVAHGTFLDELAAGRLHHVGGSQSWTLPSATAHSGH
jgi:hypothetical protein